MEPWQTSTVKVIEKTTETLVHTNNQLIDMTVLPGISVKFIDAIKTQLRKLPEKWLEKFRENNYSVILAPSIAQACAKKGIRVDKTLLADELMKPQEYLGNFVPKQKTFIFCEKNGSVPIQEVVNQELCKPVIKMEDLLFKDGYNSAILDDLDNLARNKPDDLTANFAKKVFGDLHNNETKGLYERRTAILERTMAAQMEYDGPHGKTTVSAEKNILEKLFPSTCNRVRKFLAEQKTAEVINAPAAEELLKAV